MSVSKQRTSDALLQWYNTCYNNNRNDDADDDGDEAVINAKSRTHVGKMHTGID